MTEPDTPGSDPTQLATRAVRDGDGYVLDGHKWFTSNGSIADFLIVMAVTDPEAPPHRRASMFIVPVDAPGRDDRPRRPDDGAPAAALRRAGRPRRDPLRGRPARPRRAAGRGGRGLPDRAEAPGAGPHPPLHALARHGPARVRRDVRARAVPARQARAAARHADGPGVDRRLGGGDAGGAADDAPRRVAIDRDGLERGAHGRLDDQVLRRQGAARRGRPRGADPRRARLLGRHAARDAVPVRAPRALRRRRRRGAPRDGRPPRAARLQRTCRTACPSEHVPTRREAALQKFAEVLAPARRGREYAD